MTLAERIALTISAALAVLLAAWTANGTGDQILTRGLLSLLALTAEAKISHLILGILSARQHHKEQP